MRVPASSANLGPGFDVMAAALSLHLELEVEETGRFAVHSDLPGVPLDRENLCVRAFEMLHPAAGIEFRLRSEIPVAAGLGSSAAASVAGLLAGGSLAGGRAPIQEHATRLEGHPDNAAAALLGGFVICAPGSFAERVDPPPGLAAVVAIPPYSVPTADARALLPPAVPIEDAVHNTAQAALLVLALARGDLDLLPRGLSDRIHQPRREPLYRGSMELVRRARSLGAIGATISGAGPTVLFWCREDRAGEVIERLAVAAPDHAILSPGFSWAGATVM